ncbi:hypothetical protein [Streptomyces qinzhouensis]|uniref:DUF3426 domain-containing protein n=1 Tax=Streptomyces qinzhouensis TaxID=2599401 RepID=A0A5B8IMS3_9ACTN|nr:hypothetical protein [Streptomyces qinzhouensis]QDY78799.1 hypothetical protein FQU76_22365 [Streptomyces qinzhouensis]
MRTRHGARPLGTARTASAAALAAAALMFSLTACGLGGTDDPDRKGSDPAPAGSSSERSGPKDGETGTPGGDAGETDGDPAAPLATIKGSGGFEVTYASAKRDSGGYLTITGIIKNISGKSQFAPLQWSGQETEVKQTGPSLAGMTLVDKAGKKRYYVLRDTDGNPLTTTGLSTMQPGQSLDFFAQYPAPPAATKSVDVLLPLMPTATIGLS